MSQNHSILWHAYTQDKDTLKVLGMLLHQDGGVPDQIHEGGIDLALSRLSDVRPTYLLVSFDPSTDSEEALTMLAGQCARLSIKLVILGLANHSLSYAFLKSLGVDDYWPAPFEASDLRSHMQNLLQDDKGIEHQCDSRFIGFLGVRGGVGASTLCANTAALLSKKQKTMLVDLDVYDGALPSFFSKDMHCSGLDELLVDPSRINHSLITSMSQTLSEQLEGVGARLPYDQSVTWSEDSLDRFCASMYGQYPYVVFDLSRHHLSHTLPLLEHLHALVWVCDHSQQSFEHLARLVPILEKHVSMDRWHLWFNDARRDDAIEGKNIADRMGIQHTCEIPYVEDLWDECFIEHEPFVWEYQSHAASKNMHKALLNIYHPSDRSETSSEWEKIMTKVKSLLG